MQADAGVRRFRFWEVHLDLPMDSGLSLPVVGSESVAFATVNISIHLFSIVKDEVS